MEAQILYTAVFHNEKTIRFAPEMLNAYPDIVESFAPGEALKEIVHVYDVSGADCAVYNDIAHEHLMITLG